MSKTEQQNRPQRCADCEQIVTLVKKENRQLTVQCDCETRQIKVRKATPEDWE